VDSRGGALLLISSLFSFLYRCNSSLPPSLPPSLPLSADAREGIDSFFAVIVEEEGSEARSEDEEEGEEGQGLVEAEERGGEGGREGEGAVWGGKEGGRKCLGE